MKRQLNVSIIQMPIMNTASNLKYIEDSVNTLMKGYVKPELIIGVEYGIGEVADTVPGDITNYLGAIARKYGIYFIPGTMMETTSTLPEGQYYNTCPIFGPDGEMITSYRKKVPFRPGERSLPSEDDEYCIFKIPEKDITVGLLICYDQFFPEIPRTLALEGAELIVCPSFDPIEFKHIPDIIPRARALENEVFYIWTNSAGVSQEGTSCGNSVIVNPEGNIIYKCGDIPTLLTKTLDFDTVTNKRLCGEDQHLNSLRYFNVKYPYAQRINEAPLFKNMPSLTNDADEYSKRLESFGNKNLAKHKTEVEILESDKELEALFKKAAGINK